MVGGWSSARRMEGVGNLSKVSELNNKLKVRACQECLRNMKCREEKECGEGAKKVQRYSNGVYQ